MAGTEQETIGQDDGAIFAGILEKPETESQEPAPKEQEQPDSRARDEQGRFKAAEQEQPKGDDAPKVEPASPKEEPKVEDHRVPLRELLDERDRRQKYEREAEELRRWRADQERKAAEAARPKREMPDVLQDPEAYARFVREDADERASSVKLEARKLIIDMSFDDAREASPEVFDKAFGSLQAAVQSGDTRLRDQIVNAPNPGRALMKWHKEQEAMREVGTDLNAYKAKFRDSLLNDPEFRKEAMGKWREQAVPAASGDRPNVTDLPSLNRATGSGASGRGDGGDDAEVFRSISSRKR